MASLLGFSTRENQADRSMNAEITRVEREDSIGATSSEGCTTPDSQEARTPRTDAVSDVSNVDLKTLDSAQEIGCFEGPEKTLEVCFKPEIGDHQGCRALSREDLDRICEKAKCTILTKMSNDHLDAYVLSESSLFVYSHKMLLKTCGTTTLLRCIELMLQLAEQLHLELEWLSYSRKNYSFPGDQLYPHCDFQQELKYLQSHSKLNERLGGSGYVLGPVTGDHWFAYVADKCERPIHLSKERTINMMMFDMDWEVAKYFHKEYSPLASDMTTKSGIYNLVPGAKIDDCAFDPCGYSMNSIMFDSYTTIHVTPEDHCSYASFETNTLLRSYRSIVNNVLTVFKPKRFVLTMMADKAGFMELEENPFERPKISIPGVGVFARTSTSSTTVEVDCCCLMGNWQLSKDVKCEGLPPSRKSSFC